MAEVVLEHSIAVCDHDVAQVHVTLRIIGCRSSTGDAAANDSLKSFEDGRELHYAYRCMVVASL